jgi:hypothetical protein
VGAIAVAPPSVTETHQIIASLSSEIRTLLQEASAHRIAGCPPSRACLHLGRRLRQLAGAAAMRRDASRLALLESALAFCSGGHTAGEERLTETLAELNDGELLARLASLPRATPPARALRPRLTGLIVFRKPEGT